MMLFELIQRLEEANPLSVLKKGFNEPHSYRGYYDRLAFQPVKNISVFEMLQIVKGSVDQTYTGYKGGEYTMNANVEVYLAMWGSTGDELSHTLLDYMLEDTL